ncbi:hypothetical protein [Limnoraphis robusta]|uniref:hypothetical protein n=1 Tax=Limnoraphis robusta TaxID=1118279 RepID=UPI002B216BDF|nr:hypothetical protein [Limnoraphis robusta]
MTLHNGCQEMTQTVTRKQLQAYGMSKHHTQAITKGLTPKGKRGQACVYSLIEVVAATKDYIQRPGVKLSTREALEGVLTTLLELLGNVVEVPFSIGTDPELRQLVTKLNQAMAKTDASLAALKADAAEINHKYDMMP